MRKWLLLFFSSLAFADPHYSATDLAKKSQNPVEDMISLPMNSSFNFGYGNHNNVQYLLDIKPVIPFHLTDSLNLVTRTIIPIAHQPNLFPDRNYINGIGDINPSFFLSPSHPDKLIWGIGPTIFLPTASNKQSGQGKYSIGPSFVVLSMPGSWVLGFLTYNAWSVTGDTNRSNINEFEFQYFINYNFPCGWYITTQPIITADWTATSNNRWTIPVGFGGGHVFNLGPQPINISLQAYDNVKTPQTNGPSWQFQVNISLLFPK